jgi:farnesol dehydrogenase
MDSSGKAFVTGANGFIGTRLIEALVQRGQPVRALSRRPNPQPDPPPGFGWNDGGPLASPLVEWVRGDITDRDSLVRGMEGCSQVYHLAACAKNWARDPTIFHEMNVQGMRNVFDAAVTRAVQRVVWTSTMLTFGPTPRGQVYDEESPRSTDHFFADYDETKTIAEQEALRRAAEGFPVVIVNPARVYGPGHLTEGNSVSLLIDQYDRGLVPFLLNLGVNVGNWVYIDDVVQGHILAMKKGRIGQRYILGGENASLKRFFRLVDQVSGKRHFQVPVFRYSALIFAWILKKRAEWFGVYPQISPGWVRMFLADWAYSTEKAQRELGYRPTPLAEGLKSTYEWLQKVRKERA